MLMRVGLLLMLTGFTFILLGWLGAIGPGLLIIGSGCAAVAFEAVLAHDQAMAQPVAAEESAVADLPDSAIPPTSGTHRAA